MAIDIQSETVLSFADAARQLPKRRGGKRVNIATLYRWASQGFRGVFLEYLQVGGTRCTSLEALDRFFQGCTPGNGSTPCASTSRSRSRRVQRAEKSLASRGW